MIDGARHAANSTRPLAKRYFLFPLWLKVFFVLALAFVPLGGALLWIASLWQSDNNLPLFISQLPYATIAIGGYSAPSVYVYVFILAIVGIMLGLSAAQMLFIQRVRSLTTWLIERQREGFRSIPLPPSGRDELGELGRQLTLSTLQFAQTQEQNKDLADQKSVFLTMAAHQLRTPLTGLSWSIESLLNPTTPEESRQQLLADIDDLLKRMRLIVNHILASADIGEGRFGYVFEKIDIVPFIEQLVSEFKPVAEKHGVSILFEDHSDTFPVYADKERISLALFNLISNAVDYTPARGTVRISAAPQGKRLEIAVADTGIGIAEAELPFLFNKFYRSERAKHIRPDGSGLGLYLARNVINRHGSEIHVQSAEDKGARFSFFLDSNKKNMVP